MRRGYQRYLLMAAALMMVILGMLFFTLTMMKRTPDTYQQANTDNDAEGPIHFIKEVETISGETISSGIQEMGELITAEYYYSHAESYESLKKLSIITLPGTKVSFVYTVDGYIKAGIDFSKVSVTVDDESRTLKLVLPAAKIMSSEIDHDTFQTVSESTGIFADLSAEDVNKTFVHVKEMEEEKAITNGLLINADDNAAKILESFVKSSFDLKDYTVAIEKV